MSTKSMYKNDYSSTAYNGQMETTQAMNNTIYKEIMIQPSTGLVCISKDE